MATIQIRIDEKTKRSAKRVLDALGIDMSTAIKTYLKQIAIRKGMPFRLVTQNGLTPAEERAILKASKEAAQGKNVKGPFESADELIKSLNEPW
jgi:DNA-damage-inducible protein J